MQKMNLSIGFADMAQFVRLPEALGWEGTIEVLKESIRAIGDIIIKHDGRIHKYGGDAILFSCPDPYRAIRVAKEIAEYRHQFEMLTIRYYVAIATGQVFLTEIGHPTYLVKDIIGEPVLRANWLLSKARKSSGGFVLCNETKKFE